MHNTFYNNFALSCVESTDQRLHPVNIPMNNIIVDNEAASWLIYRLLISGASCKTMRPRSDMRCCSILQRVRCSARNDYEDNPQLNPKRVNMLLSERKEQAIHHRHRPVRYLEYIPSHVSTVTISATLLCDPSVNLLCARGQCTSWMPDQHNMISGGKELAPS